MGGDAISTKEEITVLVERIQGGERALMLELWKEVERLVAWYANKVIPKVPKSFEDLYDLGYISLVNTVDHYERDISFIMLYLKTAFAETVFGSMLNCI